MATNRDKLARSDPPDGTSRLIAPPATNEVPLGLEDIDQGDIVLPRYTIVQPTSKEGTEGKFRANLTGQECDELQLIPIVFRKGMVLWDKEDRTHTTPLCRSNDAMQPDPAIAEPVSPVCHQHPGNRTAGRLLPVCPKAKWNGGAPPDCSLTYNLIALDLQAETPFMMSFSRTGARAMQRLLSAAWMRRKALFDLGVKLRLSKVVDKGNKYYVPEFYDFVDNEPGAYRPWYDMLRAYNPTTTFEAEEQAAQGKDGAKQDEEAPF